MLKKVALMLLAMALPIRVLPVPGGPNSSSPLAGALAPYTKRAASWVGASRVHVAVESASCSGTMHGIDVTVHTRLSHCHCALQTICDSIRSSSSRDRGLVFYASGTPC